MCSRVEITLREREREGKGEGVGECKACMKWWKSPIARKEGGTEGGGDRREREKERCS